MKGYLRPVEVYFRMASFYGADLTEEAYNDPLPDIVIAHASGCYVIGPGSPDGDVRATRRPAAIARAPYRGRLEL